RWMVLPQGGQIDFDATGQWSVPHGTIFIKHFALDQGPDAPATRLETRFLVHEADGVRGYVYRWNDAGTEATLLESGDTREVSVTTEGGATTFAWQFPARHQCRSCHTSEAGGVLGLETAQLNREVSLHGLTENQLETWTQWSLFSTQSQPSDLAALPAHPHPDDTLTPLDARARSWLHVNCASCHMGQASGGPMDLRVTTPLADTATCDVTADKGDMGLVGGALITPGSPESSVLYQRIVGQPPFRMPPLASARHDTTGVALVEAWVSSLTACPP
ncbi:MAG: hypothetical protein QF464_07730, partial [Myxococcota bacterium]|nr:hypothetical protein [Myxococcota bacterium]